MDANFTNINTELGTAGGDFSNGGDTATADRTIGNNDNYDLGIETNGSTRIHVEGGGNVIIGKTASTTTLSTYALEVYGADPAVFGVTGTVNGIGTKVGIEFNQKTDTSDTRYGGAIKSVASNSYTAGTGVTYDADLALYSAADGVNNERLRITSDGRGLSQFTAKAWVNFNGTGTVAIRDSHNVSSITDNGTADYTTNFSNAMSNSNYVYSSTADSTSGLPIGVANPIATTTSLQQAHHRTSDNAAIDCNIVVVTVFGD